MKRLLRRLLHAHRDRLLLRHATSGLEKDMTSSLHQDFLARCWEKDRPRVLELGTLRSNPRVSTRHDDWVPNASEYLGLDITQGLDVDIVGDIHRLSQAIDKESFDVVITCSTFEHFKYPHLAAHEIMKALRVGGILFVQTHQTFPLHAYPYDYFRFSREALASLFGTRMGFRVIATDYEFPSRIFSARDARASKSEAYLNVRLFGEKFAPTPEVYEYEYDV